MWLPVGIGLSYLNKVLTLPSPTPQIPLFQAHPQLKQCVRQAIERAVQELVHPVVDRSIKIAMTTCEQIVRKDFALDSEESRMRIAAHHMMRNLTAGMAMITCREPLLMSISTNLKNSFASALRVSWLFRWYRYKTYYYLSVIIFFFSCIWHWALPLIVNNHYICLISSIILDCNSVRQSIMAVLFFSSFFAVVSSTQCLTDSRYPYIYWFK